MAERYDASGPIIVWINHGYEGWHPRSYDNIKEAVLFEHYTSDPVFTWKIDPIITAPLPPAPAKEGE